MSHFLVARMPTYRQALCDAVEEAGLLTRPEAAKRMAAIGLTNKAALAVAIRVTRIGAHIPAVSVQPGINGPCDLKTQPRTSL